MLVDPLARPAFYSAFALPLCFAVLVAGVALWFLERDRQIEWRAELFEVIADLAEAAPAVSEAEMVAAFQSRARPLLALQPVNYLSLVQGDTVLVDYGLPLPMHDFDWLGERLIRKGYAFTSHPLRTAPDIYLVGGVSRTGQYLLGARQWLAGLSAIAFGALILYLAAQRLRRRVAAPLLALAEAVEHRLEDVTHDAPLRAGLPAGPWRDLAAGVEALIERESTLRQRAEQYYGETINELRETLETIEIQNIELDLARKTAVKANRLKAEFLADTGRELKAPLAAIAHFVELLARGENRPVERGYLAEIRQAAESMSTCLSDVLDYSRLENGELNLTLAPFTPRQLLEDVLTLQAPLAHHGGVRLHAEVGDNVPSSVKGDAERLRQILASLVQLAVRQSPRGRVEVAVKCITETDGRAELKWLIGAMGADLSELEVARLNRLLAREMEEDALTPGANLSLAIARGLIARMGGVGGAQWVGHGQVQYWFSTELVTESREDPAKNSLQNLSIAVLGHDPWCREELERLLAYWSAAARWFGDAGELLQTLHHTPPHLVLVDSYSELESFNRTHFVEWSKDLAGRLKCPLMVLAPVELERVLGEELAGSAQVLPRPIRQRQLHAALCRQLHSASARLEPVTTAAVSSADLTQVLVVDDNPQNRRLLRALLEGRGLQVVEAEDGREALGLWQQGNFAAIFMDAEMPVMNGATTAREIRQRERHSRTPIIAVTSHTASEYRTQLLLAGMDDFLSKPLQEAELKAALGRWLQPQREAPTRPAPGRSVRGRPDPSSPAPSSQISAVSTGHTAPCRIQESLALANHKPGLAYEMLNMLIESLPATRTALLSACNSAVELRDIAHKLHGGACYCGTPELRSAAKNLEQFAESGGDTESALETLLAEIDRLWQWSEEIDIAALFGVETTDNA